MAKPGNPYHDPETGEFTSGPDGGGTLRYSKMGNQARAKIATSHFKTKFDSTGKATSEKAAKYSDGFMKPWKENARAVATKTAKALDRDFIAAKHHQATASIEKAIAGFQGTITKVPAGVKSSVAKKGGTSKPKQYKNKPRMHVPSTNWKNWK